MCTIDQRCVGTQCVGSGILYFTVKWSTAGDVDTYVTTPTGKTISYTNRGPDAGTDNGNLDVDDTSGTGPENVFWATGSNPPAGTYLLCVHPYDTSVMIGQTIYYQLNSATILTHTLVDTVADIPDPCTTAYPNYLGSLTYP